MTSTSTFCHILIRPRARLASRNRIDTLELHLGVGRNEHLRRLLFVGTERLKAPSREPRSGSD